MTERTSAADGGDRALAGAHDDPAVLRERMGRVLDFYYPACIDEDRGGYVAQFHERTGEVYDPTPKHLVATSRFVANFSLAARLGIETDEAGPEEWRAAAEHGVAFLEAGHRDSERGGYRWLLDGTEPVDERRSPYGHAFVLLAYARATEAGVGDAEETLHEVASLVEERFVEGDRGLLRSDLDADWEPIEPYRGQNANMHACEAFLAAYEATDEERYLDRAVGIARAIAVDLADRTGGRLWEHFDADWNPDSTYNEDDPAHQFRPWGYQPGHHLEWAKLLRGLARHREANWLLARARELFDFAVETGWDGEYGGFYYTVDGEGKPVITEKYGWAVAEGVGAAAALAGATGEERYREWYDRLWDYTAVHLAGDRGNWYSTLTRENEYVDTNRGPAVEPGYHPVGACYEALRAFE